MNLRRVERSIFRAALLAIIGLWGCAASPIDLLTQAAQEPALPFAVYISASRSENPSVRLKDLFVTAARRGRTFNEIVRNPSEADVRVALQFRGEEPRWSGLEMPSALLNVFAWGAFGVLAWWLPAARYDIEQAVVLTVERDGDELYSTTYTSHPREVTFREAYGFVASPGAYLLSLVIPPCLFPALGLEPEEERLSVLASSRFASEAAAELAVRLKAELKPERLSRLGEIGVDLVRFDQNLKRAFFKLYLSPDEGLLRFDVLCNGEISPECDPASPRFRNTYNELQKLASAAGEGKEVSYELPALRPGRNRVRVVVEGFGRKARSFTFIVHTEGGDSSSGVGYVPLRGP